MKAKPKFPKPKKIKRSTLKRKCDVLFSKIVRSHGKCELEGIMGVRCKGPLQTMHIAGRRYLRLRWDSNNVLCGCAAHHLYFTHRPLEFYTMVQEFFPTRWRIAQTYKEAIAIESLEDTYKRLKDFGS